MFGLTRRSRKRGERQKRHRRGPVTGEPAKRAGTGEQAPAAWQGLEPLEPRLLLSAGPWAGAAPLADAPAQDQQAITAPLDAGDAGEVGEAAESVALPPVDPRPMATTSEAAAPAAGPFPNAQTFQLHSNPGADRVIHLDFDGHTTSGTLWNDRYNNGNDFTTPAYDRNGDSSSFGNGELTEIQHIWQRVAEDYIPFDVDVTTEDPGAAALRDTGGGDQQWGARVVLGGSSTQWFNRSGGVAYIGSYDWASDTPCYVFTGDNSTNEGFAAEAASHEAGHTFGLYHDGQEPDTTYYTGHGSGETAWAPIMGNSYYESITQWSQGEYYNADRTGQDDLSVITRDANGVDFRSDDHSDLFGFNDPTPLDLSNGGATVTGEGIITTQTDRDHFKFSHSGGAFDLSLDNFERGPNLDIAGRLYRWNSAGNSWSYLEQAAPDNDTDATIAGDYQAGDYLLEIDGDGFGSPQSSNPTGYTDYASLGRYTITGSIGSIQPDRFEDNDSFFTAHDFGAGAGDNDRIETGLTIDQPDDADYYKWTAPADGTLIVNIAFIDSLGDLDLELYDSSRSVVKGAYSIDNNEQITATVTGGESYFIQVYGFNGATHPDYDLTIDGPEPAATIAGRHVFYNNSVFDGGNAAANNTDDGAIATDKAALLPGDAADFANYTSYSKGINGVMVDIAGADLSNISANDFTFTVGNDDTPGDWGGAPSPTSVSVRQGDGAGGSDRVSLTWNDNAIEKQWLQVTVEATAQTGLATADVFYFGNWAGETGNNPNNAAVNAFDTGLTRDNSTGLFGSAAIDNNYDFNRDEAVNALDYAIARDNASSFFSQLSLIAPPSSAAGSNGSSLFAADSDEADPWRFDDTLVL